MMSRKVLLVLLFQAPLRLHRMQLLWASPDHGLGKGQGEGPGQGHYWGQLQPSGLQGRP
jgi:hypothetical protein